MECVGGSNDGRTLPVPHGINRHGALVDVPILRAAPEWFVSGDPGKAVDRSEVIEVYRVFRFGTDGEYYVCLAPDGNRFIRPRDPLSCDQPELEACLLSTPLPSPSICHKP